jgi:hypothetical protein
LRPARLSEDRTSTTQPLTLLPPSGTRTIDPTETLIESGTEYAKPSSTLKVGTSGTT